MAEETVYLLAAGAYEDYSVYAATTSRQDADTIAKEWNAERPDGAARFNVESVPLVTARTAGDSPFSAEGARG